MRELLGRELRAPALVEHAGRLPSVQGGAEGRTFLVAPPGVWTDEMRVRAPAVVVVATSGMLCLSNVCILLLSPFRRRWAPVGPRI